MTPVFRIVLKLVMFFVLLIVGGQFLTGCYGIKKNRGGGMATYTGKRAFNTQDVALPQGYDIEIIATGLTFPSAITFDNQGMVYVVEAGYSYGEVIKKPQLLKVNADGSTAIIATGEENGPWTGVTFHQGNFYIAEGGIREGGKILRIDKNGKTTVLVENLPTKGDHHTNGPVIHNGYIYFGLGTATNSGVVGNDNASFGWLERHPDFHDVPCKDIILNGINYTTANKLKGIKEENVITGAFTPYNVDTKEGQVIKGQIPCTGAILRVPFEGGNTELVAWGLRNPYGLNFSDNGELFVTENSFDDRGSRPVWGTGDVLWKIENGKWYGWPDYAEGRSLQSEKEFKPPGEKKLQQLLKEYPSTPPEPVAVLGVHSSSNGFDISNNKAFGYAGEAFIAQFGDMAPNVGKVLSPVGFKVVRVNLETGEVNDFAVNKGSRNAPASYLGSGGLERPNDVKFNPEGTALYIVDFGLLTTKGGTKPHERTGAIWKISKR